MTAAEQLGADIGIKPACDALGTSRATLYRRRQPAKAARTPRPPSHRRLDEAERQRVLDLLDGERFADQPPAEVFATLLDEGTYLCSVRTMYRILEEQGQVRERRNQLRHPTYSRPELMATGPRQLWSWDITKLKGPDKWQYLHLYVILDVFSRYVVGWMVAERESAVLAERLIATTIGKELVDPIDLTIHADRGPSMRSKCVAQLLTDLGVTKTHSRPYTSTDNPFSESQFKTMKYRPDFPGRFEGLEHARGFLRPYFHWYNQEHHHHGLALLTPAQVHQGLADQVLQQRQQALNVAYAAHPERFSQPPRVPKLPAEVWINPPTIISSATEGEAQSAGEFIPAASLATAYSPEDNPPKLS